MRATSGWGPCIWQAGSKEAIAAYEKAVEINPYYWYNYNWLGVACFRLGESDKAVKAFRRVTELAPDWAPGYNNLGGAEFQQGKWKEAVASVPKVPLSRSKHQRRSRQSWRCFYYLGQYGDAAKALEKAVELDPSTP